MYKLYNSCRVATAAIGWGSESLIFWSNPLAKHFFCFPILCCSVPWKFRRLAGENTTSVFDLSNFLSKLVLLHKGHITTITPEIYPKCWESEICRSLIIIWHKNKRNWNYLKLWLRKRKSIKKAKTFLVQLPIPSCKGIPQFFICSAYFGRVDVLRENVI